MRVWSIMDASTRAGIIITVLTPLISKEIAQARVVCVVIAVFFTHAGFTACLFILFGILAILIYHTCVGYATMEQLPTTKA